MGSYVGTEKSAATKCGLSVDDWRAKRVAGQRHCFRCRAWHSLEIFSVDKSRDTGRSASCRSCTSLASTASRYGMTVKEMRSLLSRSGGKCELCRREADKLVIDHDHATGRVRGVLCSGCNVGMGLLGDSPERLRVAALYLENS